MRTVHCIGIFHTQGNDEYSHCAFTQKTRRLVPMLSSLGYNVIYYGNAGFIPVNGPIDGTANYTYVVIHDSMTLEHLRKKAMSELKTDGSYQGNLAKTESTLFKAFHSALVSKMHIHYEPGDIILHNFGIPHRQLAEVFPDAVHIEPGIGYNHVWAPYRIYESYAWMAHVNGRNDEKPRYGDFYVPNHFDTTVFKMPGPEVERSGFVYMGRIQQDKGMDVIGRLSQLTDREVTMIGEGDERYMKALHEAYPKLNFIGPVTGDERARFLQTAWGVLTPSQYFEPFCGVAVEAALCGALPIMSDFGVFPEHLMRTGYGTISRTLLDYAGMMEYAQSMGFTDRMRMVDAYADKYGMEDVADDYRDVFAKILAIHEHGWEGGAP